MKHLFFKQILVAAVISFAVQSAFAQTKMPDELTTGTIQEQMKYIEEHTRIYEDFRAIREDVFRKMSKNFTDTLLAEKRKSAELKLLTSDLNRNTDSLNVLLATTRTDLEEVTATKNKIRVLGLELNKGTYNTVMWSLLGGILFILIIGFLIFRRNLVVLLRTDKDLKELKEEFAAYKQTTRIAREKMEMDHFFAMKKLKESK